jgi:hypothetical protein
VRATAANAAPAQKKVRELLLFDLLVNWGFNLLFDLLLGLVFDTARPWRDGAEEFNASLELLIRLASTQNDCASCEPCGDGLTSTAAIPRECEAPLRQV